jgi:phosphomannomutase
MTAEPIISVSGLRGVVGETLTPEVAIRYASAFSAELGPGAIVLTRDGRATGRMLADVLRGTLCALGRDVIDADVAATPTTGVLVRAYRAAGGLQISASHNPAEYNGIKLFGPEGRVITEAAGQPVLARYRAGRAPAWVRHDAVGTLQPCADSLQDHLDLVLATVNHQLIRERGFRVLLDSNHGAGSLLGVRLLEELGCHVTLLGSPPDGRFEHKPEPTADNLAGVSALARDVHADVGFCQDPDADRLALLDEQGRYIGEEFTLALTVRHLLGQRPGPIVTNCSTSRMSQDIAEAFGVPFYRSKVGEANVTALMIEKKAVFGGEGNGGPIDPRVGYVRDSFVGMALVLEAMASERKTLSQLAAELPQYAIHKTTVAVDREEVASRLEQLARHFSTARADDLDGLRLDWDDRWLLVRASNTEPIVRLVAEARTLEAARALCEEAGMALQGQAVPAGR